MDIMMKGYGCERCGHEWVPRTKIDEDPTICPKCKSPYWNKPRISPTKRKAIIQHFQEKKVEKNG